MIAEMELETTDLLGFCEVIAGQSPEGKYYNDIGDGLPFYQGKKEFGERFIGEPTTWTTSITKEAVEGDILMSVRAPVGPINFATERICIGRGLAAIRASNRINRDYLFYQLLSKQDEISGTEGAVFNSINKGQIGKLQIIVPPLPEQERIVAKLDAAFAAIDTAKANVERNLHNAKELFQSNLNEVFSGEKEGWVEKRLGDADLLQIIDGDRGKNYPSKVDFLQEGHCVFMNTGNVRPNGFDFDEVVFITEEKDNLLRKGKLTRNDVVMTTRGTIGNLGLYNESVPFDHIRINSGMLVFRANQKVVRPEYLFEVFRSPVITEQIKAQTTGAAQPQLPIKTLVNFTLPIPTELDVQLKLVKEIRGIEKLTNELQTHYTRKLTELETLKKSLLERAFRGEV